MQLAGAQTPIATTKETTAIICKENTGQVWVILLMLHRTRPLYNLSHHLGPSRSPGLSLRAYLQCPTCTAPADQEQTPQNHRLPMARQLLGPKLQPPLAHTSASEIPPDCNLAQVLRVGETLISTKFGIDLCRCFYTAGMEKMKKTLLFFVNNTYTVDFNLRRTLLFQLKLWISLISATPAWCEALFYFFFPQSSLLNTNRGFYKQNIFTTN